MLELIYQNATTSFAIAAMLFFIPFELLWPKINSGKNWAKRIPVIFAIGVAAIATGILVSHSIQADLVEFLKQFQLFSLAKSQLPPLLIFAIAFLFSDFLIYAFHWLSHKLNLLWRFHAIHHSDEHVTSITGYLHHPLEVIASYIFVMFFYVIFGIPIVVVAVYVTINAAHNIFVHADIRLPQFVDSMLRYVIVTPDMHRTHHSIDMREGNSNFGQIFSFWDRFFGTYVQTPSHGEENLIMGLPADAKPSSFGVIDLMAYPFRTK